MRLWTHGTAEYSPCERYRYTLTRAMDPDLIDASTPATRANAGRTIAFIGLNPSTATEFKDDPTVRRCVGFAAREGFGRLVMLNAFAYRATDPKDMKAQIDPVGAGNDEAIVSVVGRVAGEAALAVFAWGTHGTHMGRHQQMLELVGPRHCLGVTKAGLPKHPLYLRADSPIVPYRSPATA